MTTARVILYCVTVSSLILQPMFARPHEMGTVTFSRASQGQLRWGQLRSPSGEERDGGGPVLGTGAVTDLSSRTQAVSRSANSRTVRDRIRPFPPEVLGQGLVCFRGVRRKTSLVQMENPHFLT